MKKYQQRANKQPIRASEHKESGLKGELEKKIDDLTVMEYQLECLKDKGVQLADGYIDNMMARRKVLNDVYSLKFNKKYESNEETLKRYGVL